MNKMLYGRAWSMLSDSSVSKDFWVMAIKITCYLVNRLLSTTIENKTPFHVWSRLFANYKHVGVFGCPAYTHFEDDKLELRVRKCLYISMIYS